MKMRCKVYLSQIGRGLEGSRTVSFHPVSGGSDENQRFFAATPSGKFEMTLSKQAVEALGLSLVHLGEEFYVDFTPVAEARPEPPPANT